MISSDTRGIFNEELRKALAPIRKEGVAEADSGWLVLETLTDEAYVSVRGEVEERLQREKEHIETYRREVDSMYAHTRGILDRIRPEMESATEKVVAAVQKQVQEEMDAIIASIPKRMEHAANEIILHARADLRRELRRVERRGRKANKLHNQIVDVLHQNNLVDVAQLRPHRKHAR